ncbi:hypothetical protein BDZ91DRAFT_797254 [Kalaharituber pfeilii]|nr:hypothetical protein BDZ91DRAFT_797254 [Kalaharituber pfeilii]
MAKALEERDQEILLVTDSRVTIQKLKCIAEGRPAPRGAAHLTRKAIWKRKWPGGMKDLVEPPEDKDKDPLANLACPDAGVSTGDCRLAYVLLSDQALGRVRKWLEAGNAELGKTAGIRWLRKKSILLEEGKKTSSAALLLHFIVPLSLVVYHSVAVTATTITAAIDKTAATTAATSAAATDVAIAATTAVAAAGGRLEPCL